MFVRADKLLEDHSGTGDHIVGYGWDGFEPTLTLHGEGRLECIRPMELDLFLSRTKTCVGRFEGERYIPCPDQVKVNRFNQCRDCASTWIPIQECIFEPKCGGERCDCHFCSRPHLVYAAFQGRRLKVGMTSSKRLETRGIEQGADAIVPLVECKNRMEARRMENELSRILGASQRVTQKQSLEAIAHPSDERGVMSRYRDILDRARNICDPMGAELIFLEEYPLKRLDRVPRLVPVEGSHRGELVGMKGKFAIYESKGAILALNMFDAVGRWDLSCPPSD